LPAVNQVVCIFLLLAFDGANLIGDSVLNTDPPAGAQLRGPGHFATTHWSVVLAAAQTQSPEAEGALEALCRQYWYPLYAWLRRKGHSPHEAEDLTQEFFSRRIVTKYIFKGMQPTEGRFRSWLLTSLQNMVRNEWQKGQAAKRGGDHPHCSLDFESAEGRYMAEPAHDLTPEKLYDRSCATELLNLVANQIREKYRQDGKIDLFQELKMFLPGGHSTRSHAEVAARLGKSEDAVKMAVSRLRQEYGRELRAEVKRIVNHPDAVDMELRHLRAALED
jgi:RNA polymerase sigma factor (sigma-70 family)